MKFMTTTCLATIGLLAASPIWAEATDAGAAALQEVFKTYLGPTEGVVSVVVDGDSYGVTFDLMPLLASVPLEGLTASTAPVAMKVTDNGDGTWAYEINQPFSMSYAVPGQVTQTSNYASVVVNGVFDTALGDSREYTAELTGITSEQTQSDPNLGEISIKSTVESVSYSGVAVAGATGLDATFKGTSGAVSYDVMVPMGEGAPPTSITGTIEGGTFEGGMTGYQPTAIYGLLAWFVAHPDEAAIMADKAGLKAQIESALPVFANLSVSGGYSGITITTPLGVFGLDEVGVEVGMNGAVPDGLFREAITLKGLTMPDGVVPPFAVTLVPDELSFDVAVSSFDLDAAAKLALTLLDLPDGAEPPEGFDMQMLAALMPQGAVNIALAPGGVKNATYALTYEGAMVAGMGGMPTGTAKVTLTGIDGIMAALDGAPPEMTGQIIPVLGMAQAMGQPGAAGELVWEIDASTPGSVKINGMDMMGGQ
jgi:hypothetical protein